MLQNVEDLPPSWDNIEERCQHLPLNCPWTITCQDGTLAVIITSLEWTFHYEFWIRVTAHPEENPNISKQIDNNKHHPLLDPLSEELNDYVNFSTPHLNSHQLHIPGELVDILF